MNIINNNVLLQEIRRIVKDEIPKKQIESLWKYLNLITERLKILEKKEKLKIIEEKEDMTGEIVDLAVRKEMNNVYKVLDKFRKKLIKFEIDFGNKGKIEGLNRNEK